MRPSMKVSNKVTAIELDLCALNYALLLAQKIVGPFLGFIHCPKNVSGDLLGCHGIDQHFAGKSSEDISGGK